jgi:chitin synthase
MSKLKKRVLASAVPDLLAMEQISAVPDSLSSEDATSEAVGLIAATLHGAYNESQLYTYIGNGGMVALAPPTRSTILAELSSQQCKERWYKLYKNLKAEPILPNPDGGTVPHKKDPHVYALSNLLYFHLRRSGVNQALVLRFVCATFDGSFLFRS